MTPEEFAAFVLDTAHGWMNYTDPDANGVQYRVVRVDDAPDGVQVYRVTPVSADGSYPGHDADQYFRVEVSVSIVDSDERTTP